LVFEHHLFPVEKINEALNEGLPARHGGFTDFIAAPEHAPVGSS
jgi:alcohol dehydrogenase